MCLQDEFYQFYKFREFVTGCRSDLPSQFWRNRFYHRIRIGNVFSFVENICRVERIQEKLERTLRYIGTFRNAVDGRILLAGRLFLFRDPRHISNIPDSELRDDSELTTKGRKDAREARA